MNWLIYISGWLWGFVFVFSLATEVKFNTKTQMMRLLLFTTMRTMIWI